jgi:hypothetical protein
MVCYFCKRDKNETDKMFSTLIIHLEKKVSELEDIIEEKRKDYRRENGFTVENNTKIKNIDENLLTMKINYIKNHFEIFLKLEPNLDLLMSYFKKHNEEIAETDDIKSLADRFMKEPTDERLYTIIKDIIDRKDKTISDIEMIKENIKFKEVKNKNAEIINKYEEIIMLRIIKEKSYYFELHKEKNKPEKIYLCPYCFNLFDTFDIVKYHHEEIFQKEIEKLKGKYDHKKNGILIKNVAYCA